ncbi:MAG: CHAD domain-containing protein [Anaerolineae bacterium]|nr:CHAD domain-containing protein [Anaerolineae bacterium]
MEIEAKYGIPDEQTFRRLQGASALAGFDLGQATATDLQDTYLDTTDRAILAGGYACRLRREGGRYLATLKGLGSAADSIHRREELETELPGPLPPNDWPPGPARDLALRLASDRPLVPLLVIEQTRYARAVRQGERQAAQLTLDRVRMVADDPSEPPVNYLELEAELLPDGREEDLAALGAELEAWGLSPESRSKFERALSLLDRSRPATDRPPHLTPTERSVVERLAHGQEVIARRARLLLAWDSGAPRAELLEQSGLSARQARFWLSAFRRQRLDVFPQHALEGLLPLSSEEAPPAAWQVTPAEELAAPPKPVELLRASGVEPEDAMSEAGRKTFRFHFRRMLYHEPGTRLGQDPEALHDMRVATRRMRAAFRVFGSYYDESVAPYEKGLKRIGRVLGAVRDLDVFRQKIVDYLGTLPGAQRGSLDPLLAVLEARREAARQEMLDYLDGKKYARLKERFGEFVETKGLGSLPLAQDGEPQPYRVRHVAPVAIYDRLAAVRAYDEWVTVPNPPVTRLHALRIVCKRLRYALEFFREVLGPETKGLISQVVEMQDHLGELQDAVVASGILRDFMVWGTWGHEAAPQRLPDLATPVIAPGVAAYLAVKQAELQRLLDTFPPLWQRFYGSEFSRTVAAVISVL